MNALVSVIIPVYNGERYLAEAIGSAQAQTYRPIEIIVVDDGSTDGTAEVVKPFIPSVHYVYQENGGTGAARNRGIEAAQGDFFAFLDADDLWQPDKLSLQMAAFAADPQADILFGHLQQFFSPDVDESLKEKIACDTAIVPGYLPSAMVVRRDSFFRVGRYETHWKIGQDVSWVMRAMEQGLKMVMIPEVVFRRRIHASNKGITQRAFITQRVRIIKASLDRRRQMGLIT